ncbi:cupin domain-containing protein [bacterium]|nr:cupin domain-containing protein [bacterium]
MRNVVRRDEMRSFRLPGGAVLRGVISPKNSLLERVSVNEVTLPPGVSSEEHYHIGCEEVYFILDGEGVVHLGGESFSVSRGDAVFIPPELSHRIENPTDVPLRFLSISSPPFSREKTVSGGKG